MNYRYLTNALVPVLAVAMLAAIGCTQDTQPERRTVLAEYLPEGEQPAPAPRAEKPQPRPTGWGPYAVSGRVTDGHERGYQGDNFNSLYFPNGMVNGPLVLEVLMPDTVYAGTPFDYYINVYNTADYAVRDVVVKDELPEGFSMSSSSPDATNVSGRNATWNLGKLEGNDSATIKVSGTAEGVGSLVSCATVTFVPFVCASTDVVQPALEITKTLPEEVLVCDPIVVQYVVSNPGTARLSNITVEDKLPAGLKTASGRDTVSFTVDSLDPGQSRSFQSELRAESTGTYTSEVVASASTANLTARADDSVVVRQPVLAIEKDGPAEIFAGRVIDYTITVRNTGDVAASNVVVTDQFDGLTDFVRASDDGRVSGNTVTWNLGTLAPNASKSVTLTVRPRDKGRVTNMASVAGTCAESVSATAATLVSGIPAVLLEMVDLEDPIQVGDTVTYLVTVTNQGSAQDTDVVIVCEMEEQMEFVEARGATPGQVDGRVITFQPLPVLAPKAKAEWYVTVRATAPANVRFRTQMETGELTRPVIKTESTNFYE